MASFTTRVELHNADSDDYDTLHSEMTSRGFKATITSDAGVTYYLPPAEYDCQGNITRSEVLAKAEAAAGATGREYAVLVTESAGRSWNGLAKVKKAA